MWTLVQPQTCLGSVTVPQVLSERQQFTSCTHSRILKRVKDDSSQRNIYIYVYVCIYIYICLYIYIYKCIEEWCIELVLQLHLSCNICGHVRMYSYGSLWRWSSWNHFTGQTASLLHKGDLAVGCPCCLLYIVLACLKMRGSPTSKENVPKNDEWDFGGSKLDGDNPRMFFFRCRCCCTWGLLGLAFRSGTSECMVYPQEASESAWWRDVQLAKLEVCN